MLQAWLLPQFKSRLFLLHGVKTQIYGWFCRTSSVTQPLKVSNLNQKVAKWDETTITVEIISIPSRWWLTQLTVRKVAWNAHILYHKYWEKTLTPSPTKKARCVWYIFDRRSYVAFQRFEQSRKVEFRPWRSSKVLRFTKDRLNLSFFLEKPYPDDKVYQKNLFLTNLLRQGFRSHNLTFLRNFSLRVDTFNKYSKFSYDFWKFRIMNITNP